MRAKPKNPRKKTKMSKRATPVEILKLHPSRKK
jgi:hypothetical protein